MSYSLLSQLSFELQLAGLWEEKLKEEQVKTGPLEEVCAALREALDAETKKRMEAFENKMKPIIIKDGPSRKVSTTCFIFFNSQFRSQLIQGPLTIWTEHLTQFRLLGAPFYCNCQNREVCPFLKTYLT